MKPSTLKKIVLSVVVGAVVGAACLSPLLLRAQPWFYAPPPMAPSTNPMAQRAGLQAVQSQMNWFQNSLRNASGYQGDSYGNVFQQFQALRGSYNAFQASLTSQQQSSGANDLAQLSSGLDILQEAFSNYQQEVADGESSPSAFNNMCSVLYQASNVWLQELNQVCNRLRVGWN